MFVHGGAWQRGDKQHLLNTYGNFGIACARAGAVGVVINYRLAPEVRIDVVLSVFLFGLSFRCVRSAGIPRRQRDD